MPASNHELNLSLVERLTARIRREGPISFRDWMQTALYDERDGYYCRPGRVRQGRTGDYRTAPETSPLFARTLAQYFSKLFIELGSPSSLTIFEAGAGTGVFAHGVLTTLQSCYPNVFSATRYVVDEISADARAQSASRLSEFADRVTFQQFCEFENAPDAGILFSNELIDALPVHRVTMRDGKMRELCVGLNENNFVWVDCDLDPSVADYGQRTRLHLDEGQIAEINLDAEDFVSRAALLVKRGFVITVDYGAERNELLAAPHRREGTLRAFHRHQLVGDVLSRPGEQDLTTTVDWTQIREAGERSELKTLRHERLDQFLLNEGLLDELEKLTSDLPDVDALLLRTSAREMIMPDGLTASFQVLVQKKGA